MEEGSDDRIDAFMKLPSEERNCNSIFNLGKLVLSFWYLHKNISISGCTKLGITFFRN